MISIDVLRKLRNQHGWTQEQLASISGVSTRTIQRIEKSGECSLESKMAIAAAFHVSPQYLSHNINDSYILPAHSPWSNLLGWGILISLFLGILLINGDGEIKQRLHINAIVMVATWLALSLRTINTSILANLLLYSLGYSKIKRSAPLGILILNTNQLIRFTYISALIAFIFHLWQISQSYKLYTVSIFSESIANLIAASAIASLFYAILMAEFVFKTAKLRLETALLKQNVTTQRC